MCGLSVALLVASLVQCSVAQSYRTIDGSGNNFVNTDWGSAGSLLLRYSGNNWYSDGVSSPAVGPNPRTISNIVFNSEPQNQIDSLLGFTDYVTYWGQFIDHDMDLTPGKSAEFMPIEIPECDTVMDPMCWGNQTIPFRRSLYQDYNGVREHMNHVTSFLDGSQIYGSDNDRALTLRSLNGGKLKTSPDGLFPPKNTFGIPMDNDAHIVPDEELFACGDVRCNENPGLLALQVLFLREHNRLAEKFAQANPTWDDEKLYQEARKWNIALLQQVTIAEYVPITLGDALEAFTGYSAITNPTIMTEFSTGAFRYGHSEVNSYFLRLDNNGDPIPAGPLYLRESYSNPSCMDEGLDSILKGMALQTQKEVDTFFPDDLRNYLFGSPGSGGMDLVAINTFRARDMGIPRYNDAREMFGLPRVTSFSEVTADTSVAASLSAAYNGYIDACDLYVCGLAEDHTTGGNVGPTFEAIIREQYKRTRNGDRFWFQNFQFNTDQYNEIRSTTLAKIILRNTNITSLQCFVMSAPSGCTVEPEVTTSSPSETTSSPTTTGSDEYDFLVTLLEKTPNHPFYELGNTGYAFAVNGEEYAQLTLERGRTYKFKNMVDNSHSLFLSRAATGSSSGLSICSPAYVQNCNAHSGLIMTFTVPLKDSDFFNNPLEPGKISYACVEHSHMGGPIILVEPPPTTSEETTEPSTTLTEPSVIDTTSPQETSTSADPTGTLTTTTTLTSDSEITQSNVSGTAMLQVMLITTITAVLFAWY